MTTFFWLVTSKNQNPREGIETRTIAAVGRRGQRSAFKKPKSPRGD